MTQHLHQLADQLEEAAKELRQRAIDQDQNEILERVIAPGGIFHGENWHKNFKWIINGPFNGNLVANEFDWERFSSQMHPLASHPKSEEFLKNRFRCTIGILPGHLSFNDPKEYVPFIRKYNIEVEVDISKKEKWEKQLETSQLVCQLFDEQKATEGGSTATDELRAEVERQRNIHINSPMEEQITFHTTPWDSALKLAEDLGDVAIELDLRPFSLLQPTCQFLSPEAFRVSFVTEDGSTERAQVIREYRDRLSTLTEEKIENLLSRLDGKKVVIPFPHGTAGEVFHACFDVFLTVLSFKSPLPWTRCLDLKQYKK